MTEVKKDIKVVFKNAIPAGIRQVFAAKLTELYGNEGFVFADKRPAGAVGWAAAMMPASVNGIEATYAGGATVGYITFKEINPANAQITEMTIPLALAKTLTSSPERQMAFRRLYGFLDGESGHSEVFSAEGWPIDLKPRKGGYRHARHLRKWRKTQKKHQKQSRKHRQKSRATRKH